MAPVNLVRNHDEFINAVKLRLTKLEVTPVIYLLTAVCTSSCASVMASRPAEDRSTCHNSFIEFSVNLHPTNREDVMKEKSCWLVFQYN